MMPGMMGDEEDKIATVIVSGMDDDKDKEPADLVGSDAAVEDMMSAIKANDSKMFKDALKSFIYFMESEEPEED